MSTLVKTVTAQSLELEHLQCIFSACARPMFNPCYSHTPKKKKEKEKGNMNKCISGCNFLTRMPDITLSTSIVKEHFNFNWMCISSTVMYFQMTCFLVQELTNILGLVLCSRLIMTGKNMYIFGRRLRYPIKHVNLPSVRVERTKSFHM